MKSHVVKRADGKEKDRVAGQPIGKNAKAVTLAKGEAGTLGNFAESRAQILHGISPAK